MHSGIILADGILFFEVEKFDNLQRCITKLNTFEIFWDYSRRMKCVPDVKFWTWLFVKDNLPQPTQLASSKSNYHPVDEIIAYQSEKLFYKWFILKTHLDSLSCQFYHFLWQSFILYWNITVLILPLIYKIIMWLLYQQVAVWINFKGDFSL